MNENPFEQNKNSQIERGFEALSSNLSKHLNPEYADDLITQEKKKRLDKAFEDVEKFSLGKTIDISDTDVFNIIQTAFMPYSSIQSVDKVFETLSGGSDIKKEEIERVGENKWVIKTDDALKKILIALRDEHRTLKRKGE